MRLPKAVLVLALAATIFAATPRMAPACEFLKRLFGCESSTQATYALYPMAAPCATPCAAPVAACATPTCAPQTCGYTPTVSYQTYYTPVATTVYQPVTTVNPCTGCSTTAYRPYTVLTQQAQLVPYTSYTPVASPCAVPCATGSCDPCSSGVAPTSYSYADPAASGCSTCIGGSTTVAPPVSSTPYGTPPATLPSMPSSALPRSADPADVRPSINDSTSPQTFESTPGAASGFKSLPALPNPQGSSGGRTLSLPPTSRYNSLPPTRSDAPTSNGTAVPNTDVRPNSLPLPVLPNPNDRQAMRAVRQVTAYEPIVNVGSLPPSQPVDDEMAWHASSR